MKKENWALGLSIVAISTSVIAVFFYRLRCEPMSADWMGILVGVLALLVTILIGWSIYTIYDFRKSIGDIKDIKKEVYMKSEQTLIDLYATMVSIYREVLKGEKADKIEFKLIVSYLQLIVHEIKVGDYERSDKHIQILIADCKSQSPIHITQEESGILHRLLGQISSSSHIHPTHLECLFWYVQVDNHS